MRVRPDLVGRLRGFDLRTKLKDLRVEILVLLPLHDKSSILGGVLVRQFLQFSLLLQPNARRNRPRNQRLIERHGRRRQISGVTGVVPCNPVQKVKKFRNHLNRCLRRHRTRTMHRSVTLTPNHIHLGPDRRPDQIHQGRLRDHRSQVLPVGGLESAVRLVQPCDGELQRATGIETRCPWIRDRNALRPERLLRQLRPFYL